VLYYASEALDDVRWSYLYVVPFNEQTGDKGTLVSYAYHLNLIIAYPQYFWVTNYVQSNRTVVEVICFSLYLKDARADPMTDFAQGHSQSDTRQRHHSNGRCTSRSRWGALTLCTHPYCGVLPER
jgi:hypothetical protein